MIENSYFRPKQKWSNIRKSNLTKWLKMAQKNLNMYSVCSLTIPPPISVSIRAPVTDLYNFSRLSERDKFHLYWYIPPYRQMFVQESDCDVILMKYLSSWHICLVYPMHLFSEGRYIKLSTGDYITLLTT